MPYPAGVTTVMEALERAGFEAYAVGGCVRDRLLGRAPIDWDVTTSATPDQIKAVFQGARLRVFETGLQHGTLTVRADHMSIEVTTYRADGTYTDHRRPDAVDFVRDLASDLMRRDFTINAMAMGRSGQIIDLHGGQRDLRARIVRAVGDAQKRFEEDALRILRALRFACQLDFSIDADTALAARRLAATLGYVSVERIYAEIARMVVGPGAGRVLREHAQVLEAVVDIDTHMAGALDRAPADATLRLTMLLRDAPAQLRRLKADNKTISRAALLGRLTERDIPQDRRGALSLLHTAGDERAARDALTLWHLHGRDTRPAEAALDALLLENACYHLRDLRVDGRDLAALGLRGPAIGRALEALLERVMAGELPNEKTALLHAARPLVDSSID